jgi:hypothetical protein
MSQECVLSDSLATKLLAGQHWTEAEKAHVIDCEHCVGHVLAALDRKKKADGPVPDSVRARPSAQKALERARQIFHREFGISLANEPPPAPTAKAS